jgi:hypothetical protein
MLMFAGSIVATLGAAVTLALAAIFQQEAARATDPDTSGLSDRWSQ